MPFPVHQRSDSTQVFRQVVLSGMSGATQRSRGTDMEAHLLLPTPEERPSLKRSHETSREGCSSIDECLFHNNYTGCFLDLTRGKQPRFLGVLFHLFSGKYRNFVGYSAQLKPSVSYIRPPPAERMEREISTSWKKLALVSPDRKERYLTISS